MSRLEDDRQKTYQRSRATQRAVRLTNQKIEEAKRVIEESRALLDHPIYPDDHRTAPKVSK